MTKKIEPLLIVLLISATVLCCKPRAQGEAKRYELKGKVESVDKQIRQVTIAHEDIPGFMGGMTMPFNVKDTWALEVMNPGDRVQATLVVEGSRTWLEDIVVVQGDGDGSSSATSGRPGPPPGDEVPDFKLINQDGKQIGIHQYRGRTLLLTFIYTRCPLPDFCPLMTRNFAEIEKLLQSEPALYGESHLLSVSVDPDYDKAPVLNKYGKQYARDLSHWEFASGTQEQVKNIAGYFGLDYYPEKDQIIHSLVTALIGPDGKVVKTYRGNEWLPAQVVEDLRSIRPL